MKFSASQNSLLSGLMPLAGIAPSKSPMPILTHILATLKGNSLTLAATDLDVSMENKIEVNGGEDGQALLPARKIIDLLRELPDIEISISVSKANRITLTAKEGKKDYKINSEEVGNYPKIPVVSNKNALKIDKSVMRRMIGKSLFAVSKDELRPQLTGLFLQLKNKELRVVATDGHRLVKITTDASSYAGETKDFIVPAKAMGTVQRMAEGDGEVEINFTDTQIAFRTGNMTLSTKLIEGKYPNYEAVIPKENKNTLKIDVDEMRSAVRRASILSNAVSRQIRLKLEPEELSVQSEDVEEGGEADEAVACKYDGEPMEIGYNANYVLDMLKQIDTNEVQFELGSPTSAGIVRPTEQENNEDLLMLVMPVRLN